MDVNRSID